MPRCGPIYFLWELAKCRTSKVLVLCRAAFAFVFSEAEAAQPSKEGGFLGRLWILNSNSKPRAVTEFPADDMRALDGLERILRQAGVLNK